jgi:hypothetical protein
MIELLAIAGVTALVKVFTRSSPEPSTYTPPPMEKFDAAENYRRAYPLYGQDRDQFRGPYERTRY